MVHKELLKSLKYQKKFSKSWRQSGTRTEPTQEPALKLVLKSTENLKILNNGFNSIEKIKKFQSLVLSELDISKPGTWTVPKNTGFGSNTLMIFLGNKTFTFV